MTNSEFDAHSQLAEAIATRVAQRIGKEVADSIVGRLSDDASVERLVEVWSNHLDRSIGKTVRRGAYTILVTFVLILGVKLDAIVAWFKG